MKSCVQLAWAREGGRWSTNRRRRCGNVKIARLGFWRDFQARWEGWKSPGLPSPPLGRGPDFSTLSPARHFHSEYP